MTFSIDERPLLMAAILTMLVLAGSVFSGAVAPTLTTGDFSFTAGTAAGVSAEAEALPLYAAFLSACDAGSSRPECPSGLPQVAPVIGRISADFGQADGWLAPGGIDRFTMDRDVAGLPASVLSAHLEGDAGASLGVFAAGRAILAPSDAINSVRDLAIPAGVGIIQIVVHNPTDAAREYRLVID